jgi:hypothetical protein
MSTIVSRVGRRPAVALAAGLAGAALLAACSSSGGSSASSAPAGSGGASSSGSGTLAAAGCPSTVKIQTSWYPEAEKAAAYALVGANGKADTDHGTYSASIGGVTVSVLAGGPYLGNQSTTAKMYQDPSILLGEVSTDDAIETSAKQPVVAVVAPLQASPKAIVFDPSRYSFKTIADVGRSGATILKAGEDASSDLLVAGGDVKKSQLDYSWDGSPGRFVTSGGKDVFIDYATETPYSLQHLEQWGKPMSSILLSGGGYTAYENSLSVTPSNLTKYSSCLKVLVPMIQKAVVSYSADPGPVNEAMIKYATAAKSPTTLTTASTAFADQIMNDKGIFANGTDGVAGSFDTTRVDKLVTAMGPVARNNHISLKSGLSASDLVTNQFLDTSVKFGA